MYYKTQDGVRKLILCSQNTTDNAAQIQTSTSIRFNSDKVWMGTRSESVYARSLTVILLLV